MSNNELSILRRKETVGLSALAAWLVFIVLINLMSDDIYGAVAFYTAWILTTAWVALDAEWRKARYVWWTIITLATGPLGALLYVLLRRSVPALCTQCGSSYKNYFQPCPACGYSSIAARATGAVRYVQSIFIRSLVHAPREQALHTTKHMAITLAGVVLFGFVLRELFNGILGALINVVWGFSFAGYWVLVAWWVYLDARWRKMDAAPWAILTLVTNIFGLVSYLVIRYPNPQICPKCSAYLGVGLKRCPYCGTEAEPTCPRCQAQVKADWIYCPSCAVQLPKPEECGQDRPSVSTNVTISGTVIDAVTGAPLPGAVVSIDSRKMSVSAITDYTGRFALIDMPPRPYVLVAVVEGYRQEAKSFSPNVITTSQVHFTLNKKLQ